MTATSCNDWLDLLPNNEQVTDNYWQTKEDVESVIASGYYYMRNAVPQMLLWGELRGGTLFNNSTTDEAGKIQDFDAVEGNSQVKYATFYQIINMANSVLMYAPTVQEKDNTYYTSVLNSHLCEAYFQRAFAYSILVKNFKEVPLILEAYVNDDAEFNLPKASETQMPSRTTKANGKPRDVPQSGRSLHSSPTSRSGITNMTSASNTATSSSMQMMHCVPFSSAR